MSKQVDEKGAKPRVWSLELVIMIALPVTAVIGGIITMAIATSSGFKPHPEVKTDRFAQEQRIDDKP